MITGKLDFKKGNNWISIVGLENRFIFIVRTLPMTSKRFFSIDNLGNFTELTNYTQHVHGFGYDLVFGNNFVIEGNIEYQFDDDGMINRNNKIKNSGMRHWANGLYRTKNYYCLCGVKRISNFHIMPFDIFNSIRNHKSCFHIVNINSNHLTSYDLQIEDIKAFAISSNETTFIVMNNEKFIIMDI